MSLAHVIEVYKISSAGIGEQVRRYQLEAEGSREAFDVACHARGADEMVVVFQGSLEHCGHHPVGFHVGLRMDEWAVLRDKFGGLHEFKWEISRVSNALRET